MSQKQKKSESLFSSLNPIMVGNISGTQNNLKATRIKHQLTVLYCSSQNEVSEMRNSTLGKMTDV